ncbi:MAG: ABC transporter permease [Rhodospirillaceae bacterium]
MRLINRRPSRAVKIVLTLIPFVLVLIAYGVGSHLRRLENPSDKLLPAPGQIMETAWRLATAPDRRSGDILLWVDTAASLERLGLGIGLAAILGLVFGLLIGLLPLVRANLAHFVSALSLIPPLAILPILFIIFGLGEASKIALITIGVAPFLIRDMAQRVLEIPTEQIIKAQTLAANTWIIAIRVVLPQIMPRLIQGIRLGLGPAWLFLIAAEAIASQDGLGYRIFLVRRYLAMDVILPYVVWITLLAYIIDWGLRRLSEKMFPWAGEGGL